jgi:hypothetical protein
MKQFVIILIFAIVGVIALLEQSKPAPNRLIMIGAMTIFMYGLFQLMKKIPSKKEERQNDEV